MRKWPVWLHFSEPPLLVELFSILLVAENISFFCVGNTDTFLYPPTGAQFGACVP